MSKSKAGTRSSYWLRSGWLYFGPALAAALFLWLVVRWDPLLSWLFAVNPVTFLAYGLDKRLAGAGLSRVPERLLLVLALSGGSLGAWLGMRFFHHKTRKSTFQRRFWAIVAVQVLLILAYWLWVRPLVAAL